MPNPFASQAPLSSAVGGNAQAQRRNPFASSAPLASTGASAGSDGALGPAAGPPNTGPPPTSFAGGSAYHAQAHGVAHGGGMYPTPPEMTPPGHLGGSNPTHESVSSALARPPLASGTPFAVDGGAVPGVAGRTPFGVSGISGVSPLGAPTPFHDGNNGGVVPIGGSFGSNSPNAGPANGGGENGGPGFVSPGFATAAIAAPTLFVPAPLVAPTSGTAGVGGPVPGSVPGGGGAGAGPRGPGPGPGPAAPISLRGRERYCSGGAWVGPAPEWPRPPADATVAGADTSGVLPRHAPIVAHVRRKHASLLAASVGAKRRELESLDAKLGGMLVFLNAGEGETHLSAPVADALLGMCVAADAGDAQNVNAYLLHISTHYWEEVAYWFPALKRLTRL